MTCVFAVLYLFACIDEYFLFCLILVLLFSTNQVSRSLRLVVKQLRGLLDTSLEERPVLHDQLDVLNGQIDQHTSDLWSLCADEIVDMLVQYRANLVFVVRVLGHNCRDDLMASHQVTLLLAHLRLWWLLNLLNWWLHLWRNLHHRLSWSSIRRVIHAWLVVRVAHMRTTSALVTLTGNTVAHRLALRSTLEALRTAWMPAGHWSRLLLHEIRHGLEQHLEVELELFLVGKIGPFGALRVLLTELLEVMLVTSCFVLEFTNLLDFIVVDRQ